MVEGAQGTGNRAQQLHQGCGHEIRVRKVRMPLGCCQRSNRPGSVALRDAAVVPALAAENRAKRPEARVPLKQQHLDLVAPLVEEAG